MKPKRRVRRGRIVTGNRSKNNLYRAVIRYIEERGGMVVVIGGVSTFEWPQNRRGLFTLGIKIMGSKPNFKHPTP